MTMWMTNPSCIISYQYQFTEVFQLGCSRRPPKSKIWVEDAWFCRPDEWTLSLTIKLNLTPHQPWSWCPTCLHPGDYIQDAVSCTFSWFFLEKILFLDGSSQQRVWSIIPSALIIVQTMMPKCLLFSSPIIYPIRNQPMGVLCVICIFTLANEKKKYFEYKYCITS